MGIRCFQIHGFRVHHCCHHSNPSDMVPRPAAVFSTTLFFFLFPVVKLQQATFLGHYSPNLNKALASPHDVTQSFCSLCLSASKNKQSHLHLQVSDWADQRISLSLSLSLSSFFLVKTCPSNLQALASSSAIAHLINSLQRTILIERELCLVKLFASLHSLLNSCPSMDGA